MQGNPRQSWILNSTSWIPDFQVVDFSLCRWNLDSRLQLSVGFPIPWAVFRIPKSRIWDSTSKFSQILDPTSKTFLDSGIRIPSHRATSSLFQAFRSCGVWPEIREREIITKKGELRERGGGGWLSLPTPSSRCFSCSHLFGSALNLNASKTVYDSFVKRFARTDDPAVSAMQATPARTTSLWQSPKTTKKKPALRPEFVPWEKKTNFHECLENT